MDTGQPTSPIPRQRSLKTIEDVASLTTFNPFSEEDEHDQSSYAIVTSLFSKVKNTLAAPLTSAVASNAPATQTNPPAVKDAASPANPSSRPQPERPNSLAIVPSNPAPPLVFLTPVVSEAPSYNAEYDRPPSRGGLFNSPTESNEALYGTAIPGFPTIADDARSVRTSGSANLRRTASASKVIRRIRGEGLSRDYWMDDKNAKECYDCKSVFTTWRRKHHCRICGQIFCSRCASNIIKGSRFGQDGMVRVCNLCLEKLENGGADNDEDDDHRSVMSTVTSHAALPQSPFAASQLFYRTDEPYSLFSIAETRCQVSDDGSGSSRSRPLTPGAEWDLPAPFRRNVADEERERERDVVDLDAALDAQPAEPQSSIKFPTSDGVGQSTIQFPASASDGPYSMDTPRPMSMRTSRVNSFAETEIAAPFLRSRVQSRLEWSGGPEPGWRTRRESTAYAQELNAISMFHLRIMLRQMLTKESVSNVKEWEETLLKLALQIARDLTFTSSSFSMDVRQHVKIKKIPGGAPRDSEYVDGAVVTKNVAHKQMARSIRNPRVMLVTFPFEFHRVEGQYMHLDPLVSQEKQYLTNLVGRVAALRPHVVLVEKSVSRIALEALVEHNIAVARTVKPSAIQFVARMTQADVFSSMDKLAVEPRLGHCAQYRLQTFDHALIPGRRKTYMRFEGSSRDMGCTIVLRGGDLATLKRIKNVTRFLAFVVRHLKMETHLWKDSVITLPPVTADAVPAPPGSVPRLRTLSTNTLSYFPSGNLGTPTLFSPPQQRWTPPAMAESTAAAASALPDESALEDEDLPHDDATQLRLSRRIQQSFEPYLKTFISISATLRFPPPYPIRRMKELDDLLQELKCAWEDDVILKEEKGPTLSRHDRDATVRAVLDMNAVPRTPELPKTPTPGDTAVPNLNDSLTSYFDTAIAPSDSGMVSMRDSIASIVVPPIEGTEPEDDITVVEKPGPMKDVVDIAKESALSLAQFQHDEHRPVWEWYLRKNPDDFVIEHYQTLTVREFLTPLAEVDHCKPCTTPQLTYYTFYGENDCTLGQYIDRSISDGIAFSSGGKAPCVECEQSVAAHCKVYVHNESKLLAATEPWSGKIQAKTSDAPVYDMITTWSVCRRCGQATPFIPVSEETLRYSFAKFLELHFYPADVLIVPGAGCSHNIYLDHARYFAYKGMTVRFQADPVVLQEIVFPPRRIRVRPETLLELKNGDYQRMLDRSAMWFSALVNDFQILLSEVGDTDPETSAKARAYIEEANGHRLQMARDIHTIYAESLPTDTLALGRARQLLQDRMVDWQVKLDAMSRLSHMTFKEPRRATTFGSVRHIWPSRRNESSTTLDRLPSSNVSEMEEEHLPRVGTAGSLTQSSASENDSAPDERRRLGDPTSQSESEQAIPVPLAVLPQPPPAAPHGSPISLPRSPVLTKLQKFEKSDPESDSTIGARRMLSQNSNVSQPSKLPRRPGARISVAELVQRYQEGPLDAKKSSSLASDGRQEPSAPRPRRNRSKKSSDKRPLLSDFEQSYAANIAPKYLTHVSRRQASNLPHASRIPGPIPPVAPESRAQSRQTSPEKRQRTIGATSKPPPPPTPGENGSKATKGKATPRVPSRDKSSSARPNSVAFGKSTFRRSVSNTGSKVSNITRHFERISKDSERANRRYAVIRGRRARPVASARPKVQVFDSIQDVMRNETGSSDSSSDADDEDDDDDDEPPAQPEVSPPGPISPSEPLAEPELAEQEGADSTPLERSDDSVQEQLLVVSRRRAGSVTTSSGSLGQSPIPSVPPSPGVPTLPVNSPALTPPEGWGPTVQERHSFMKAISGLWTQQLQPISKGLSDSYEDGSADPVHIHRDSPIALRTDEPTSIIAVALSCKDYRERQKAARLARRKTKLVSESAESFMPDDRSTAESTSSWGVVDMDHLDDEGDAVQFLKQSSGSEHVWSFDFAFDDVIITCVTMFPEQFHALRRICECEKSIIESLARCVKWNATGGKSGSAFLKTRDDRFIAKELSKAELTAMATFAPAYFEYMASTISAGRPTLLAKIFGCFRISFTKPRDAKLGVKSKTSGTVFLVMENLFYDGRFTKIYDLKGSTRNRHVRATGRENEVLLDENLVQTAHLNPLYVREHSKRILRGALWNDSRFLAALNVMDYSLVVGVDSVRNELVMGIVDYIRTYTWDKKLESWVKDASFLGGGAHKGEPTIVTPKQYKARFRSAMERYFPLVPDRWMKHEDQHNEDGGSSSLLDLWPDC